MNVCMKADLSMSLQPFVGPWHLFSFLILYTVGRTLWTGDKPVARPLIMHRTTQTQNKRTHTSKPRVGFKHTTPVFERAKNVHALDCAATVVGRLQTYQQIIPEILFINQQLQTWQRCDSYEVMCEKFSTESAMRYEGSQ
jgi:hypothetical protein